MNEQRVKAKRLAPRVNRGSDSLGDCVSGRDCPAGFLGEAPACWPGAFPQRPVQAKMEGRERRWWLAGVDALLTDRSISRYVTSPGLSR